MATHINIFTPEWCELIFVQRNKSYGAFEIRQTSGKRHLLAIMVTLTVFVAVIALPAIFRKDKVLPKDKLINDGVTLTKLPPPKEPKRDIIPEMFQKIPNNFRAALAFLPPVIIEDWKVNEDTIPTMDALMNFKGDISSVTYKGDPNGTVKIEDNLLPPGPDNTIHVYVGQMPQYPGGDAELFKYLGENIKYPQIAVENGVSGTVSVQFVVFASGEIGNIQVVRGFDVSCEREACRVVKSMNRWIPGKQNGNPVNVQMVVPVRFSLQDQR